MVEKVVSAQVMHEVERNMANKLLTALPIFQTLTGRSLNVVANPKPPELENHHGQAHTKDLPILVAALQAQWRWLVTFNQRHYQPGLKEVLVLSLGQAILRSRAVLSEI